MPFSAGGSMNLILIGYRATGKTTLARLVGDALGWPWVDVDPEIEQQAGKPIARIFAEDGEPAFRDLESQVLVRLCSEDRHVLAPGGGAPLRSENRHAMKQSGKVVWLTASPETIHRRMSIDATTGQRRPNLTSSGGLEEIVELLQRREPIYRALADWIISTENRPPESIAAEILTRFRPLLTEAAS